MTDPTVEAEDSGDTIFGHTVSDLQTDVVVGTNAITGTLHKVTTGALARDWGEGYFLVLKFDDYDEAATKVLVGLTPSVSSGLVDVLPDPDKNGVFKITDKDTQQFTVVTIKDNVTRRTKFYDLTGLVLDDGE